MRNRVCLWTRTVSFKEAFTTAELHAVAAASVNHSAINFYVQ